MDKEALNKAERPRDLRKKNKRLTTSRNALKERNREKAVEIKHLSGKIDDLKEAREKWRQSYEKEASRSKELHERMKEAETRLDKERQLVQQLSAEVELFKKKAMK